MMSVGNASAHALSPPLRSLTSTNFFSKDFMAFTANCESLPNLQTTKTGFSREIRTTAASTSSARVGKGISREVKLVGVVGYLLNPEDDKFRTALYHEHQ